ncbi:hypothetical protein LSH36_621g01009 [Paralvinella palmiformis]|uniref:Uncharacterized protein n=1 Tax=Paralvinella palmiformis TaxID=53620 RepID=A0AAD9MW36_9ANNE|nr:hypothetical protein LSH36_621g01009 [Paralvinella palmiformis]
MDRRKKVWMNREALAMHTKKHKAWIQHKSTKSDADHLRVSQVKNQLFKLTRQLCKEFEKLMAQNVKSNPKYLLPRYCNSKLKNKHRIDDIKASDSRKTQCDLVKADILDTYISSVFTHKNMEDMPYGSICNQQPGLDTSFPD